ncbi:hypothetical protein C408_1367 [Vibrio diabolicus E0666]|nr:hypothetical protein C408_1367 [Vibrio diabolicus E0666]
MVNTNQLIGKTNNYLIEEKQHKINSLIFNYFILVRYLRNRVKLLNMG